MWPPIEFDVGSWRTLETSQVTSWLWATTR